MSKIEFYKQQIKIAWPNRHKCENCYYIILENIQYIREAL